MCNYLLVQLYFVELEICSLISTFKIAVVQPIFVQFNICSPDFVQFYHCSSGICSRDMEPQINKLSITPPTVKMTAAAADLLLFIAAAAAANAVSDIGVFRPKRKRHFDLLPLLLLLESVTSNSSYCL